MNDTRGDCPEVRIELENEREIWSDGYDLTGSGLAQLTDTHGVRRAGGAYMAELPGPIRYPESFRR